MDTGKQTLIFAGKFAKSSAQHLTRAISIRLHRDNQASNVYIVLLLEYRWGSYRVVVTVIIN